MSAIGEFEPSLQSNIYSSSWIFSESPIAGLSSSPPEKLANASLTGSRETGTKAAMIIAASVDS